MTRIKLRSAAESGAQLAATRTYSSVVAVQSCRKELGGMRRGRPLRIRNAVKVARCGAGAPLLSYGKLIRLAKWLAVMVGRRRKLNDDGGGEERYKASATERDLRYRRNRTTIEIPTPKFTKFPSAMHDGNLRNF